MSQVVLDAPVPANEFTEHPLGIGAVKAGSATPCRDRAAGEEVRLR